MVPEKTKGDGIARTRSWHVELASEVQIPFFHMMRPELRKEARALLRACARQSPVLIYHLRSQFDLTLQLPSRVPGPLLAPAGFRLQPLPPSSSASGGRGRKLGQTSGSSSSPSCKPINSSSAHKWTQHTGRSELSKLLNSPRRAATRQLQPPTPASAGACTTCSSPPQGVRERSHGRSREVVRARAHQTRRTLPSWAPRRVRRTQKNRNSSRIGSALRT